MKQCTEYHPMETDKSKSIRLVTAPEGDKAAVDMMQAMLGHMECAYDFVTIVLMYSLHARGGKLTCTTTCRPDEHDMKAVYEAWMAHGGKSVHFKYVTTNWDYSVTKFEAGDDYKPGTETSWFRSIGQPADKPRPTDDKPNVAPPMKERVRAGEFDYLLDGVENHGAKITTVESREGERVVFDEEAAFDEFSRGLCEEYPKKLS